MTQNELLNVASAIQGKLMGRIGSVLLGTAYVHPYDDGDAESGPSLVPGCALVDLFIPEDLMYMIGITEDSNMQSRPMYTPDPDGCDLPTPTNFVLNLVGTFLADAEVDINPFPALQVPGFIKVRLSWDV